MFEILFCISTTTTDSKLLKIENQEDTKIQRDMKEKDNIRMMKWKRGKEREREHRKCKMSVVTERGKCEFKNFWNNSVVS